MAVQLAGTLLERGDRPLGDHCPLDRAVQLLGNRTAVLLLREVAYGASRFDALARRVGVTDAVAAQRLKELVAAGVLEKVPYREPGQRTRHEYALTESGHALVPVLLGLLEWGRDHLPAPGRSTGPAVTHDGCGAAVHVEVRCAAGHQVDEADVVVAGTRRSATGTPSSP